MRQGGMGLGWGGGMRRPGNGLDGMRSGWSGWGEVGGAEVSLKFGQYITANISAS